MVNMTRILRSQYVVAAIDQKGLYMCDSRCKFSVNWCCPQDYPSTRQQYLANPHAIYLRQFMSTICEQDLWDPGEMLNSMESPNAHISHA